VQIGDISLDYLGTKGEIPPQHYAFLVSEFEFDQIFRGFLNGASSIGLTPIAIRTVVVERWHLTLTH
jgi:hypothetical protein